MVLKLNIIIPPVFKLNRYINIDLELQVHMDTVPPSHSEIDAPSACGATSAFQVAVIGQF